MDGASPLGQAVASSQEGTTDWLTWPVPPAELELSETIVHVWSFSLLLPSLEQERLLSILSSDELARVASVSNPDVRNRFVIARIRLRQLLGFFLKQSPSDVRFQYGVCGKPELIPEEGYPSIMFNIAHSGEVGLVALRLNQPVGIDLEKRRRLKDDLALAERFFAAVEFQYLQSRPSAQQGEAFLRIWTGKEAYTKATGQGLSCSLDSFEVLSSIELKRGMVQNLDPSGGERDYVLQMLPPCPIFLGAVASPGPNWEVKVWQWPKNL